MHKHMERPNPMHAQTPPRVDFKRDADTPFATLCAERVAYKSRTATALLNCLAVAQAELRVPMKNGAAPVRSKQLRRDLDAFSAAGLITVQHGNHFAGTETIVSPTPKFMEWLNEIVDRDGPQYFDSAKHDGQVILKDEEGRKIDVPIAKRAPIERDLRAFNRANCRHVWTIENQNYGHLGMRVPHDDVTLLDPSVVTYNRIFRRNLKLHGRFYSQLQAVPSAHRKHVRANGEHLIELDFQSLEPAMLYHLRGLQPPAECYAVPGLPRKLAKQLFLISLNVRSRRAAMLAFEGWLAENEHEPLSTDVINAAIGELLALHEPIAADFFKAKGLESHFRDSEVTRRVMAECVAANIPLLAVHDGYYVPECHADDVHEFMTTAYRAVVRNPSAAPIINRKPLE